MENLKEKFSMQNIYGDIFTIIGASGGSIDVSANVKDCIMGRVKDRVIMIDTSPLKRFNDANMFGEIDAEANMPISTVGVVNQLIKCGVLEHEPFSLFKTTVREVADCVQSARKTLLDDKPVIEQVLLGEKTKRYVNAVKVSAKEEMGASGKEFA